MSEMFGFEAFSPREIAERVEKIGVAKARLPLLSMLMLGVLAGAFIGLGALFFVLVKSEASLGFAASQLLGGLAFSLGMHPAILDRLLQRRVVQCAGVHGRMDGVGGARCHG